MRALAARGIHIHSQNAHTGKLRFEGLFNALRPHAQHKKIAAVTRRTRRGRWLNITAIMAEHQASCRVIGQGNLTVIALDTFPAVGALNRRRVPAPVLKQNGAFTFFNAFAHLLSQRT